jgi:predicted Zn-dependent protease
MKHKPILFVLPFLVSCVTAPSYEVISPTSSELLTARSQIQKEGSLIENGLSRSQNLNRINRVSNSLLVNARRLCQIIGEKSISECDYEVYYDEADEFNAYATEQDGENQIFISMGLLKYLQSDDELALVIGHEIGHHILNHFDDQAGFTVGEGVGLLISVAILGSGIGDGSVDPQTVSDVTGTLTTVGGAFDRPQFNRSQESEADLIGLRILLLSGYEHEKAANLLVTMASQNVSNNFFSSHPAGDVRLANFMNYRRHPGYQKLLMAERLYSCSGINCTEN